jgi:hypothetical protein
MMRTGDAIVTTADTLCRDSVSGHMFTIPAGWRGQLGSLETPFTGCALVSFEGALFFGQEFHVPYGALALAPSDTGRGGPAPHDINPPFTG